jgi:ribosomal protein S12 methylthiotransferase
LTRRLLADGHRAARPAAADVVIVNTCGFIDAAKEESVAGLLDAAEVAHAHGARVAAIGCLVERHRDELMAELPEIDLWCGLDSAPLRAALDQIGSGEEGAGERGAAAPPPRRSRPVAAYVKISDGCDRCCSYCAIPLIKGDYEIIEPAEVLRAAAAALAAGARELVLVGQDTSRWQRPGWGGLERLLSELKALHPAPAWLRLLYLQPDGIDSGLLDALARHAVPYVDVPLQHASGAVLRRMGRRGDGGAYLDLLARVRAALPGVAVRSTFIAGFPGETEDEFEESLAFVGEAGLAVAGVFPFDAQEGTAAASLPDQVAAEVACERAARLSERIDEVAAGFWQALVGRPLEVLVETGARRADGVAVGRCAVQAPDIDGRTFVRGARLRRGQIVQAVAVSSAGYDVEAVAGSREP